MKLSVPRLLCKLSCVAGIYIFLIAGIAHAQITEDQARKQGKAEVLAKLHLSATNYLRIQQREDLEDLFANAVIGNSRSVFFYKLSNEGDEIRGNTVIHHLTTDASLSYLIGVSSSANGEVFRIGGFTDSFAEFNRMLTSSTVKVGEPSQAQALADLYLAINPQNVSFVILKSVLDFKQGVERECHDSGETFSSIDREFTRWWLSHGMLYANTKFGDTIEPFSDGFRVSFFTLSLPLVPGKCGAVPVVASIEISNTGEIKPVQFNPYKRR